jgi:hypothetical protein
MTGSPCRPPPPPPSSSHQHGSTCIICDKEGPNVSSAQATKAATPFGPGTEWGWCAKTAAICRGIEHVANSADNKGCGCTLTLRARIAKSTPSPLHANSTPLLLLTLLQGAEHAPAAAATSAYSIYKCSHKRKIVAELDLHLSHNTE